MVRVLIGEPRDGTFTYFWAEFEGVEVNSYEDQGVVYTLYKYTDPAYTWEAYRVHVSDETNSKEPTYRLHPYTEDRHVVGMRPEYTSPYSRTDIAAEYPHFIKDLSPEDVYRIDPLRSAWTPCSESPLW
jgi:hypothetical protein